MHLPTSLTNWQQEHVLHFISSALSLPQPIIPDIAKLIVQQGISPLSLQYMTVSDFRRMGMNHTWSRKLVDCLEEYRSPVDASGKRRVLKRKKGIASLKWFPQNLQVEETKEEYGPECWQQETLKVIVRNKEIERKEHSLWDKLVRAVMQMLLALVVCVFRID